MKKCFSFLMAATIGISGFAQWNSEQDICVTAPAKRCYTWEFCIDKETNDIITVFRGSGKDYNGNQASNTYINIFDKDGVCQFEEGSQVINDYPTMSWEAFGDLMYQGNDGNIYVAVQNTKNVWDLGQGEEGTSELNCHLYKLSPKGKMLWDEPVDLNRGGYALNIQAAHTIAQIADGSIFVAWMDYNTLENERGRILIERVSKDGELMWEEPMVIEDEANTFTYPYLLDAGDNQLLLVYAEGSRQDLMVRKIDFDGSSVWSEDVTVYQGGFGNIPLWTFLSVISDGKGGCFVGWYDDRNFTQFEQTYVAHVTSEGKHGFPSGVGGEAVGYCNEAGLRSFAPTLLYDEANEYLYVLRKETNSGQGYQRLMIQKVAMTGELEWGAEGVEMRPDNSYAIAYFDMAFAEDGNIVAFYMSNNSYADQTQVGAYAHKFDIETGEPMWVGDLLFTTLADGRSNLTVSDLIDGKYWVAMWEDEKFIEGEDNEDSTSLDRNRLYMQRINIDGTYGEPTAVEKIEDDEFIAICISGNNINASESTKVYNVNGIEVAKENLPAGIYIVRNGNKTTKVAIN